MPSNNPVANLQMRIFKDILGVQKQTTNVGVLLELGRFPIHINAVKLAVKNWERIRKGNANAIICATYIESTRLNLKWTQSIKTILEVNGLLSLFLK